MTASTKISTSTVLHLQRDASGQLHLRGGEAVGIDVQAVPIPPVEAAATIILQIEGDPALVLASLHEITASIRVGVDQRNAGSLPEVA